MIKVTRSTPEHVYLAAKKALPIYSGEDELLSATLSGVQSGRAFTLYDSVGSIGCIIGHQLLWRGVSSVWGLVTTDITTHSIAYARMARRIMDEEVKLFKLHRLEMAVKVGHPVADKWAHFLGFSPEGVMRAYNEDKSDSMLYGRVLV